MALLLLDQGASPHAAAKVPVIQQHEETDEVSSSLSMYIYFGFMWSTPLVEAPRNDHGNISGLRKSVPSAIYSTHVVDAQ